MNGLAISTYDGALQLLRATYGSTFWLTNMGMHRPWWQL